MKNLKELKEALGEEKFSKIRQLIESCQREGYEVEITIPKSKLLDEGLFGNSDQIKIVFKDSNAAQWANNKVVSKLSSLIGRTDESGNTLRLYKLKDKNTDNIVSRLTSKLKNLDEIDYFEIKVAGKDGKFQTADTFKR